MSPKYAFMLTLLLFPLPSLSAGDGNKIYSGCGSSAKEARKELGKNLHTNIKSTLSSTISETKSNFLSFFSSEATSATTESSTISLCSVSIEKINGEFCASVSHKELGECAENKLDKQMSYVTTNLPKTKSARLKKAQKWLKDIAFSENLYIAIGKDHFNQGKLSKLIRIENDLLKIIDNQYIRFNIKGSEVKIVIGGSRVIQPNQDIALKVGAHAYTVTSPGHCKIIGSIQLTAKGKSVIEYDMSRHKYPQVTFTSNTPNAKLKVGGRNVSVGSTKTFKRCEGILSYSFKTADIVKEGEIKLRPGLKTVVRKNFASHDDLAIVKTYRSGELWQAYYYNIYPTYANNKIDRLSGFKINRLTLKDSFRWGYQGAITTDGDNSYTYEIGGTFSLQLLDYNNGHEAIIFGPFIISPTIGLEAGLAYHSLDGVSKFEEVGASGWGKFYQNYLVLKPNIGIDAIVNKNISISINYSRSIYINKSNTISIGGGFKF